LHNEDGLSSSGFFIEKDCPPFFSFLQPSFHACLWLFGVSERVLSTLIKRSIPSFYFYGKADLSRLPLIPWDLLE
jgi:hypothetical protein